MSWHGPRRAFLALTNPRTELRDTSNTGSAPETHAGKPVAGSKAALLVAGGCSGLDLMQRCPETSSGGQWRGRFSHHPRKILGSPFTSVAWTGWAFPAVRRGGCAGGGRPRADGLYQAVTFLLASALLGSFQVHIREFCSDSPHVCSYRSTC